jgi:hypothetical protein
MCTKFANGWPPLRPSLARCAPEHTSVKGMQIGLACKLELWCLNCLPRTLFVQTHTPY